MITRMFTLAALAAFSLSTPSCQAKSDPTPFQPTWESLAQAKPATWWDQGKFGIFIHWGPYSVAGYKLHHSGYAEAITTHMYQVPEKYEPFFKEKFGACPPEFGYKDWIQLYTAQHWNPQQWAQLFQQAGAKYVILSAEHHDGFANWDSKLTPWCATKMGPKRDLVGDLAKAVRQQGLHYGVSYHRERHPNRFAKTFAIQSEPMPLVAEEIKRDPQCAELYGPFSYSDAFIADYVARWKELETLYAPDFMWIDNIPIFNHAQGHPQTLKFQDAYKHMIADYLNAAAARGKEVFFNNKGKTPNFPLGVGCLEKDNMSTSEIIKDRWQNPATLGVSYAYMHNEEVNDLYKTPAELIRLLVDVVSKNGNLLLNIGPRADGTIPEGMQRRLRAMGKWLAANGAAIYGTTPWRVYGECSGDIITEPDVHYNKHSMRVHQKEYRYTAKDNNIYATTFQYEDQPFVLKSFKDYQGQIEKVTTIDGKDIEFSLTAEGLKLTDKAPKEDFFLAKVYQIYTR